MRRQLPFKPPAAAAAAGAAAAPAAPPAKAQALAQKRAAPEASAAPGAAKRVEHDDARLEELIAKWRDVCQTALRTLLPHFQAVCRARDASSTLSMTDLLREMHVPHELVRFVPQYDDFE